MEAPIDPLLLLNRTRHLRGLAPMARTSEAGEIGTEGHRKAAACASRQEQGHDVAALSWAISGAGVLVALIGVLVVFPRWREAVLARAERASRPEALADATLV